MLFFAHVCVGFGEKVCFFFHELILKKQPLCLFRITCFGLGVHAFYCFFVIFGFYSLVWGFFCLSLFTYCLVLVLHFCVFLWLCTAHLPVGLYL